MSISVMGCTVSLWAGSRFRRANSEPPEVIPQAEALETRPTSQDPLHQTIRFAPTDLHEISPYRRLSSLDITPIDVDLVDSGNSNSGPSNAQQNEEVVVPQPPPPLDPPTSSARPQSLETITNVNCVVCNEEFSDNPVDAKFLRPCRRCSAAYCNQCIREMFTGATKDQSRMPPRCCHIIPTHIVAHILSISEMDLFKDKFEQWSTPNPTYCPVPTCSSFISKRLLGSTGTAGVNLITCPQCSIMICVSCKQTAHPDSSTCPTASSELEEVLKKWGYKRCPKCGQGVKRMFGCTHMQCLCGAQWCWHCLGPIDQCREEGECYDEEEEESNENIDWEADSTEEGNTEGSQDQQPGDQNNPEENLPATSPHDHIRRQQQRLGNLDAGPQHFWEANFHFGDEPQNENQDRMWFCQHQFKTNKVKQEEVNNQSLSMRMQCMRCWREDIFPEIEGNASETTAKEPNVAWECGNCNFIVCGGCKGDADNGEW